MGIDNTVLMILPDIVDCTEKHQKGSKEENIVPIRPAIFRSYFKSHSKTSSGHFQLENSGKTR